MNTATQIIAGQTPDMSAYQRIARTNIEAVFPLMAGADMIRQKYFKKQVHLCAISNGKSGKCTEDCAFCSQSTFHDTRIDTYPLQDKETLVQGAKSLMDTPVHRHSVVTSGKRLPKNEVRDIADAFSRLPDNRLSYCASLGILDEQDFNCLKKAGISRYHHNLETCRSHFNNVCTTHSYDDRVNTIREAKKAGMSVCSGGLFGIGESMDQVLELALDLKELDVDAIPINFLTPIEGTPMAKKKPLTPWECLRIIALMRYILPKKQIIICGGRMLNLKLLHPLVFHAGASGIMTGSYLTTQGNQLQDDIEMIRQLGFEPIP